MIRAHLFAALTLMVACAGDATQQKADSLNALPPEAPATAPVQASRPAPPGLQLSIHGGPPGSRVTVSMTGLVLHAQVAVGFGSFGEHEILTHDTATVDGAFTATVTIPPATPPGTYYFFLQNNDDAAPYGQPVPFLVTARDGTVKVSGKVTAGGAECPTIETINDQTFSLAGAKDLPAVGTDVSVVGKLAAASTCPQDITIAVASVTAK